MDTIQDDEINLLDLLKPIIQNKGIILKTIIVALLVGLTINLILPNTYKSTTTFFLVDDDQGDNSGGLSGYLNMFGVSSSSKFGEILNELINSRRLKEEVAKDFLAYGDQDINQTLGYLNLKKNVVFSRQGGKRGSIYVLSFEHPNKEIIVPVINSYLTHFETLNQELELAAKRNLIRILDPPVTPENPDKKSKKQRLIILVFLGTVLGYLIAVCQYKKETIKEIIDELNR